MANSRSVESSGSDTSGYVNPPIRRCWPRREEGVGTEIVRLDVAGALFRARVALVTVVALHVEVSADLVEAADVRLRASSFGERISTLWRASAIEAGAELEFVGRSVHGWEQALGEREDGENARDDSDDLGHVERIVLVELS
jgi:hypothetical protein